MCELWGKPQTLLSSYFAKRRQAVLVIVLTKLQTFKNYIVVGTTYLLLSRYVYCSLPSDKKMSRRRWITCWLVNLKHKTLLILGLKNTCIFECNSISKYDKYTFNSIHRITYNSTATPINYSKYYFNQQLLFCELYVVVTLKYIPFDM